jgi:hypothetical protein
MIATPSVIHSGELHAGTPRDHGQRVYDDVLRWLSQVGLQMLLWEFYEREAEMSIHELLDRIEPFTL